MGSRGQSARGGIASGVVNDFGIGQRTDSREMILGFYKLLDDFAASGRRHVWVDPETNSIKITKTANEVLHDVSEELSKRMEIRDPSSEQDYRDLRMILNGNYTLSSTDRSNIPDFGLYARSSENFLNIRSRGTPIDTAYQELAELYPQYFSTERAVNPADQLQDINRVLGQLKHSARPLPEEYRASAKADLENWILNGYVQRELQKKRNGRRANI